MSYQALTVERFEALKASVCQPSMTCGEARYRGIEIKDFMFYYEMRSEGEYHSWLHRQAFMWHLLAVGAAAMLAKIEEAKQ